MPDSSGLFVTEQRVALLYGSFYKIFNQSRLLTALVVCDEAGAVLVDRKNATARIRRAQRLVERHARSSWKPRPSASRQFFQSMAVRA